MPDTGKLRGSGGWRAVGCPPRKRRINCGLREGNIIRWIMFSGERGVAGVLPAFYLGAGSMKATTSDKAALSDVPNGATSRKP